MELHLGRYLTKNETVDHIDRDFTNNSISNLQVLDRKVHASLDNKRPRDLKVRCSFFGKQFIVEGKTRNNRNRYGSGYFCSKRCVGLYGKHIQLGGNKTNKPRTNVT